MNKEYLLKELSDKAIEEIYYEHMTCDFPESELKPLKLLLDCKKMDLYKCFGLFAGDKLLAYSYFANDPHKKIILLDYLAVVKNMRNAGYGSIMLSKTREYFKENSIVEKVIIEAESIETSRNEEERNIRQRRIAFYKKNGLVQQQFKTKVFGTEFTILLLDVQNNGEVSVSNNTKNNNTKIDEKKMSEKNNEAEIIEDYQNIYKAILTKEMYDKNVFIL